MAKQAKLDYYRDCLQIDPDSLDQCVAEHPELFYHVADAHALAVAKRDSLKLELEEASARYAQDIRMGVVKYEGKITEDGIKERLAIHQPLIELRNRLIEAKREVDRWDALRDAFSQRGYALRDLVPLHMSRLSTGTIAANTRQQMTEIAVSSRRRRPERD